MFREIVTVDRLTEIATNVWTIRFNSARIAQATEPGQFLNLKIDGSYDPLLRRAYSVHRISGESIELIFNVHGKGSRLLVEKSRGESLDVLGPLGRPFRLTAHPCRTAILVSGGLGIAPMPVLGDALAEQGVHVVNVHGSRSKNLLVTDGRLRNPVYATDDGSYGFHGNVVDALTAEVSDSDFETPIRVFACGPNNMLEALKERSHDLGLPLEVSLECQMACGIGICQGCPVEMSGEGPMYTLVCTHGPNYDADEIHLSSLPKIHG